eukprot:gene28604-35489_t
MTDCCGMLSKHYTGVRRDLAASVLHVIPFLKELLLYTGCVDAGAKTAAYNLKKGRSLLIFIGGEKEQLMSENGKHKIYLRHRKGFVKLALQHGAHLVPMYAFGENDVFTVSQLFMKSRLWLQHTLQIGLPLIYGRYGTFIPHKVDLHMEIGKPIPVTKVNKEDITPEMVDALHAQFLAEMTRLFDRTKGKHPEHAN